MKKSPVLVIGASGLVGGCLYRTLLKAGADVTGTGHTRVKPGLWHLDITDRKSVEQLIRAVRPATVFLPAACPGVDWCEQYPGASSHVNVEGTIHVARAVDSIKGRLIFFSSDYVFDGTAGPYREEDIPAPINQYGRQKLAAEQAVRNLVANHLILRLTVVYGWEQDGKNFVQRLINENQAGKTFRVPTDQVNNPTYAPNLVEAVIEMEHRGLTGLYHLAGRERASRYQLAVAVADVFGLDASRILPCVTPDLAQVASRPLEAGMLLDKATGILATNLANVREGLLRMLAEAGGNPCE